MRQRSGWPGGARAGRACSPMLSAGQGPDGHDAVDGVGGEHLGGPQQQPGAERLFLHGYAVVCGEPQHGRPGDPGEQPPVRGRGVQDAVDHGEDVGPVGLQHVPVRVHDQQMLVRAEPGLLAGVIEDPAIPPLVRAEPARDGDGVEAQRGGSGAGGYDLGGDLNRAAERAGRHPQPARRPAS